MRTPRSCIAFKCLCQRSDGVREVSFSKRCVVAYGLRGVASEYGQHFGGESPKEVLSEAFKKSRRAARTALFKRMSRRLAGTQFRVHQSVRFGSVNGVHMSSKFMSLKSIASVELSALPSSWRPLSDVVSDVLRDVHVAVPSSVERPVVSKLN